MHLLPVCLWIADDPMISFRVDEVRESGVSSSQKSVASGKTLKLHQTNHVLTKQNHNSCNIAYQCICQFQDRKPWPWKYT